MWIQQRGGQDPTWICTVCCYTWHRGQRECRAHVGCSCTPNSTAAKQREAQRVCVIGRTPGLRKIPIYERSSIHPHWGRRYLYYPDRETNLLTDSGRDSILITWDSLQEGWETSFTILQNKQICLLPGATLQIGLNQVVNTLCSEAIQICRNYLSTPPLDRFCFDDSNLARVLEEHKPMFSFMDFKR